MSALLRGASLGAQHEAHQQGTAKLGTVAFSNSGARAAQADFLLGLALLHNFEYDEAARAFRAAEMKDSSFAMAYWLDALSYSHMLWAEDYVDSARVVLARFGPGASTRLARAKTSRERQYGAAIEAFFANADPAARSHAFADSMRHLAAAYPSDLEAQAFTALALLFAGVTAPTVAESNALNLEAAAYAERVFRARPDHPGAAHYMIHAYDDPARAAKGLAAARAYARIAPNAEHAQHMPSHIFVQLGLWDDAARSNEHAWASSREEVRARHGSGADLDFHTLNWLQYSYLEQGRYAAARALIDSASAVLAGTDPGFDNPDARYAISQLQFRFMRETDRWNEFPIAEFDTTELRPAPGITPRAAAMARLHAYETAIAHAMRGDTIPAAELASVIDRAIAVNGARASPGSRIYAAMFHAVVLRSRGGAALDSAAILLASASNVSDSLPPIGPVILLPVQELLGNMLLDLDRPREAAAAFQRALNWAPNRSSALLGLARAEERAGDPAAARQAYARLGKNWTHADAATRNAVKRP